MREFFYGLIGFALSAFLAVEAAFAQVDDGFEDEIRAVYGDFVAAQNDRDVERIGAFFIDGPDFLWVSDGQSFWGRDAVLARMSNFQRAEIWRVEPDLDAARIVALGDDLAMLHMTLALVIGRAEQPTRIRFVVSILFRRVDADWRIAALLTTNEKQ